MVTVFDALGFLTFLWRYIFAPDVEQGLPTVENNDQTSMRLPSLGSQHIRNGHFGPAPTISPTESRRLQILDDLGYDINAIVRPGRPVSNMDWDARQATVGSIRSGSSGMIQRTRGVRPMSDLQNPHRSEFFIDAGVDIGRPAKPQSPQTPDTVIFNPYNGFVESTSVLENHDWPMSSSRNEIPEPRDANEAPET